MTKHELRKKLDGLVKANKWLKEGLTKAVLHIDELTATCEGCLLLVPEPVKPVKRTGPKQPAKVAPEAAPESNGAAAPHEPAGAV